MYQRTLKKEIKTVGIGLHSGVRVNLNLKPLPINSGINFKRIDLKNSKSFKLNAYLINDTRLSSTIVTKDGIRIGTIEHLMSSLYALGIDNVLIEVDGPEIPIMDGSSLPFIYLIREAGIEEQKGEKKFLKILKEIKIKNKDKFVKVEPYDGFKVKLGINFNHPIFNKTNNLLEINFKDKSYIEELSRARTFGFMQEIELMRVNNLGLGGNLNNAIVIDEVNILNKDGLRYEDEFLRHKILDAIGDIYVIGYPIVGYFEGYKSGHAINNELMRKILSDKKNYEIVTYPNDKNLPKSFHYVPVFNKKNI